MRFHYLPNIALAFLVVLCGLHVGAQPQASLPAVVQPVQETTAEQAASPENAEVTPELNTGAAAWDALGSDVEIEVRVILAGTTGIGGSVPRELNDMRSVLTDRFKNYRNYQLVNTIWLSAWGGEKSASLVFPQHILSTEVVAVDPTGTRAKVKVSLDLDRGGAFTKTEDFARAGDIAIGRERKTDGALEPLNLLRSALTVGPDSWRAVGGVQVRVSNDMKDVVSDYRRSNSLSTTNLQPRGDEPALVRYLVIGIRTRAHE